MSAEDRVTGLVGYSGMKVPVLVASTAALTLSGEQTIDGVACVTGDRVLVKDQASSVANGIYVVDSGDWARAPDCDGPYDLRSGSCIPVFAGSTSGGAVYRCTTSGGDLDIGTDALTFSAMGLFTAPMPVASGGTGAATAIAALANLGVVQVTAEAGTNTITGTVDALVTALRADQLFIMVPLNANTGATTLELTPSGGASLTAKNVFWNGVACTGGELSANVPVVLQYDGTQFNIVASGTGIPAGRIAAKGDLIAGTADNTPGIVTLGAAGTVPHSRAAATTGLAYGALAGKGIYGLIQANNSGDATNDIDISAGGAMDATGAYWMDLASAMTGRSDATWVVGTNQGKLDTGVVGNSDYYIWLIARSDTGVVDVLFSLSSTAPTMPTNYDFKRLIGWFKRVGGTIVAFHTYETEGGGIELSWDAPRLDVNLTNTLTTSRRTDALSVPLNFSTIAKVTVWASDASGWAITVCCPDQTDGAPSNSASPFLTIYAESGDADNFADTDVRTSAAGLVASRSSVASIDTYILCTYSFRWARRN